MEDISVTLQRKRLAQLDQVDNYLNEQNKRINSSGKSIEASIRQELGQEIKNAVQGLTKQMNMAAKILKIDPKIVGSFNQVTKDFVKANQFSASQMMKYAKGDLNTVIQITRKQAEGIQRQIGAQQQELKLKLKTLDINNKQQLQNIITLRQDIQRNEVLAETTRLMTAQIVKQKKLIDGVDKLSTTLSKNIGDSIGKWFKSVPVFGNTLAKNISEKFSSALQPQMKKLFHKALFKGGQAENGLDVSKITSLTTALTGAMGVGALVLIALAGIAAAGWAFFKVMNAVVGKAIELNDQLVDIQKSFGVNTTLGKQLNDTIISTARKMSYYGIETEKVVESAKTLLGVVGNIKLVNEDNITMMTKLTERYNVSGDTAAKTLSMLEQTFGFTEKKADNFFIQLEGQTGQAGVQFGSIVEDIAGNMSQWVNAGSKNIKNLSTAAILAKKMGLSLESVGKIADSFEDLEGTLQKSSYIQFALGMDVNPYKLYSMSQMGDAEGLLKEARKASMQLKKIYGDNPIPKTYLKDLSQMYGLEIDEFKKLGTLSEKQLNEQQEATKEWSKALENIEHLWDSIKSIGASFVNTIVAPMVDKVRAWLGDVTTGLKDFKGYMAGVFNDKFIVIWTKASDIVKNVFFPKSANQAGVLSFWDKIKNGLDWIVGKMDYFVNHLQPNGLTMFEELVLKARKVYDSIAQIFSPDSNKDSFFTRIQNALESVLKNLVEPTAQFIGDAVSLGLAKVGKMSGGLLGYLLPDEDEVRQRISNRKERQDLASMNGENPYKDYELGKNYNVRTRNAEQEIRYQELLSKQKKNKFPKVLMDAGIGGMAGTMVGGPLGGVLGAMAGGVYGLLSGSSNSPLGAVSKAGGGYISGSGNGISDSIPARLSNGEFVVNATSTSMHRPVLEAINNRYATGTPGSNQQGIFGAIYTILADIYDDGLVGSGGKNRSYLKIISEYFDNDLKNYKNEVVNQAANQAHSTRAAGGLLNGPSHAAGGIQIPGTGIEVEGGEAVINKRSTAKYAALLNDINKAGGGKELFASGGVLGNGGGIGDLFEDISSSVASMPEIVSGIYNKVKTTAFNLSKSVNNSKVIKGLSKFSKRFSVLGSLDAVPSYMTDPRMHKIMGLTEEKSVEMGQGGIFNSDSLATLAKNTGFPESSLNIAQAVALAESSGNPNAINKNNNGSTDYGLWQINSIHNPPVPEIYDPFTNAKYAKMVSNSGKNWNPWTTYKSGAYKKYLKDSVNANLTGGFPGGSGGYMNGEMGDGGYANADMFLAALFPGLMGSAPSSSNTPSGPSGTTAGSNMNVGDALSRIGGNETDPSKTWKGVHDNIKRAWSKIAATFPGTYVSDAMRYGAPSAISGGQHQLGLAIDIGAKHAQGASAKNPAPYGVLDEVAPFIGERIGVPGFKTGATKGAPKGQVIWRSSVGGNHFNHVHMSLRPDMELKSGGLVKAANGMEAMVSGPTMGFMGNTPIMMGEAGPETLQIKNQATLQDEKASQEQLMSVLHNLVKAMQSMKYQIKLDGKELTNSVMEIMVDQSIN